MSTPAKTLDLRGLTDWRFHHAINAAIAEHVMGWKPKDSSFEECQWEDEEGERHGAAEWSISVDAILPLLESWHQAPHIHRIPIHHKPGLYGWRVDLNVIACGDAETLSLAASYALLRAHGVTVTL